MQGATEGIALIAAALLPAEASARPIALPLAISLLHSLREALRAFAQRFQRLALLILLQIAHALIALLATHAIPPRILALLEGLVAQLLLLANHVAKLVQRLLHVGIA